MSIQQEAPDATIASRVYALRKAADSCSHLLPHIKPTSRILDVGCGPGSITVDLAQRVPEGYVLGLDVNPSSLDAAHHLAEQLGIKNVEFRSGDIMDMTHVEDETFDIIHAHQVLLHLPNPTKAMTEMRRVVKPGGLVATRDMAHQAIIPLLPVISKHVAAVDRMCAMKGKDRFIGLRTHIIAHEAGFEWSRIETSTQGAELAGDPARFVAAVKGRFRNELLESGFATEDECNEAEEAWKEWAKQPEARIMGMSGSLLCWK